MLQAKDTSILSRSLRRWHPIEGAVTGLKKSFQTVLRPSSCFRIKKDAFEILVAERGTTVTKITALIVRFSLRGLEAGTLTILQQHYASLESWSNIQESRC